MIFQAKRICIEIPEYPMRLTTFRPVLRRGKNGDSVLLLDWLVSQFAGQAILTSQPPYCFTALNQITLGTLNILTRWSASLNFWCGKLGATDPTASKVKPNVVEFIVVTHMTIIYNAFTFLFQVLCFWILLPAWNSKIMTSLSLWIFLGRCGPTAMRPLWTRLNMVWGRLRRHWRRGDQFLRCVEEVNNAYSKAWLGRANYDGASKQNVWCSGPYTVFLIP